MIWNNLVKLVDRLHNTLDIKSPEGFPKFPELKLIDSRNDMKKTEELKWISDISISSAHGDKYNLSERGFWFQMKSQLWTRGVRT